MKNYRKLVMLLALLLFSVEVYAQQEAELEQQIELARDILEAGLNSDYYGVIRADYFDNSDFRNFLGWVFY